MSSSITFRKADASYFTVSLIGTLVMALLFTSNVSAQASDWKPIGPRGASIIALTRDPANAGVVYACAFSGGVYESSDGGLTWRHVPAPFSNQFVFDLCVDPWDSNTLYVASFENGVYVSRDRGISWATVNTGLTDLTVHDVEFIPASQTLLAATDHGVFYSVNHGGSWTKGECGVDLLYSAGLFIDPLAVETAYATTTGRGVYRSSDGGQTWTQLMNGLTTLAVSDLHLDNRDRQWVYASTGTGIFRIAYSDFAADTGNWDNISFNLDEKQVYQALTVPGLGILAPADNAVYEFNGKDAWNQWADIPSRLLFATVDGSFIHIAGVLDVLAVTGDLGQTFHPANWGIQNRFVGAMQTVNVHGWTVIYGGTDKGVELTSEFFRTGETLHWILGRAFDSAIFDIALVPGAPDSFYVGTERDGVWKATQYGGQWARISAGMVPRRINQIAQTLTGSHTLYAGTSAGLYQSKDGGATWVNEGNTVNPRDVTALATHTKTDLIVYYGTRDGQVYRTYSGGDVFFECWPGVGEEIRNLAVAPYFTIYAVTSTGKSFSSDDDGHTFYPMGDLANEHAMAIAIDPVRPWIAYAATRTNGVFRTESRGLEWTKASTGITNPGIFCIDISHDNDQLLYAGSAGVVFKSINGAASWTPLDNGLPEGKITRIHIADHDNTIVYATFEEEAVYRTSNAGQSWSLFLEEPGNGEALPIFSDVAASGTLYRGTLATGVRKSIDDGESWAESSEGMRLFVRSIATSESNPQGVFAASLSDGLFRSLDGGASWQAMGLVDRTLFKVAAAPNVADTIYAGGSLGISRSSDNGATWQDLGQLNDFIFDIEVDSSDPNHFFGSGIGGIMVRTRDNGLTWTRIHDGIPSADVFAMTYDEAGGLLYAAAELEGIFKSADDGISWSSAGEELRDVQVLALEAAPDGTLYAGTQKSGAFRSQDGGATWQAVASGLDSAYISDIAISSINPDHVFLATRSNTPGDRPVYCSLDAGETWDAVSDGIAVNSITAFAFSGDGSTLYAAAPGQIYQTNDGGQLWHEISSFPVGHDVDSLLADSLDPALLYAGTVNGGVLRSGDGGQSWSVAPGTEDLLIGDIALGGGNKLLAGTFSNGFKMSMDGGETWSPGADAGMLHVSVLAIALHPTDASTIYVGTGGAGVHKSVDGGVTWVPMNNGLDHQTLLALILVPEEPDTLYAGTTEGGVYRTTDGGANWAPFNNGLFNLTISSLALDANAHKIVYAGTEGGGVFQFGP